MSNPTIFLNQAEGITIADVGARVADLNRWALISTNGLTINWVGFFVDINGLQVSAVMTLAVTATATSVTRLYDTAASITPNTTLLPDNFVGFIGNLPTDISFSYGALPALSSYGAIGALNTTPIDMTPLATGPRIYAGATATMGRVG